MFEIYWDHEQITEAMIEQRYKQYHLAAHLGVNKTDLSMRFTGRRRMHISMLKEICEFLDLDFYKVLRK